MTTQELGSTRISSSSPMAADRLDVYIAGRLAGSLERGQRDRLSFVYEDSYRSDPGATPLSCALPMTAAVHPDDRIRPYLWGLLPDNELVLQRWARQFRVSATRPLDLLAQVGRDLPGAIQILSVGEDLADASGEVEWLGDEEIAAELRRVREDEAAWLPPKGRGRWSLAGAHPKVALVFHEGRWGRPNGALATNRILKPAIAGFADHEINEHLCLAAAALCGLLAAPSALATFGSERAVVVTRFDRLSSPDGTVERMHQEDLCQALAVSPANKYESDSGPSAAQIAALLRSQISGAVGREALWRFFEALVFNWLIAAPDAHAKNYSLLHLGRAVRLAPLYDLASALPYPGFHGPKVKLAMTVGGHDRVGSIGASTWVREAKALGLPADGALARARRLAQAVPEAFAAARERLVLDGSSGDFADVLVKAVAANAAACAIRLR